MVWVRIQLMSASRTIERKCRCESHYLLTKSTGFTCNTACAVVEKKKKCRLWASSIRMNWALRYCVKWQPPQLWFTLTLKSNLPFTWTGIQDIVLKDNHLYTGFRVCMNCAGSCPVANPKIQAIVEHRVRFQNVFIPWTSMNRYFALTLLCEGITVAKQKNTNIKSFLNIFDRKLWKLTQIHISNFLLCQQLQCKRP